MDIVHIGDEGRAADGIAGAVGVVWAGKASRAKHRDNNTLHAELNACVCCISFNITGAAQ